MTAPPTFTRPRFAWLGALVVGCTAVPPSAAETPIVDPPQVVSEKSYGMPLARRVEVPPGATGVVIPVTSGLSAPDSWTTVPHFVTDDGEVRPVVRREEGDAPPVIDRRPLTRGDDGRWRPEAATALPMVDVIRLEVEAASAPRSAKLEVPVPPPTDGTERFKAFEERDGVFVAPLKGTLRVPPWPGWSVEIDGDVTAASLVVETPPLNAAIATDRSGWLFHGAMVRVRRQIPDAPDLPADLPVAVVGPDQRAPTPRLLSQRLFGDARVSVLRGVPDVGCPGVQLAPAQLVALVLAGAPASPRAQAEHRLLEVAATRSEGGVKVNARDVRPLGDPTAPPPLPALLHISGLPVEWTVKLDRGVPLALLEAMASGLKCTGEATRPYPVDGPGIFLNVGLASVAAHQHPDGSWLVVDHATRTAWRAEDKGLGAHLAALQQTINEPGVAAWAEAEKRCPVPWDAPREITELRLERQPPPRADSPPPGYVLSPKGGEEWAFEAERVVARQPEVVRWTGTVPGTLVDALVDAARQDTLCRPDAQEFQVMSHHYPYRRVAVTFAEGPPLLLASDSQHREGAPWEVRLDGFEGTQETGAIGRAYDELLKRMDEAAPPTP